MTLRVSDRNALEESVPLGARGALELRSAKGGGGKRLLIQCLAAALAICGLATLRLQIAGLSAPSVYRKDFKYDYLSAKALLEGVDPYLASPVLAKRYLPKAVSETLPHPTPHPPFSGLLALPLALLPYTIAATVWLLFELILLFVSISLISRGLWRQHSTTRLLAVSAMLLLWPPVAGGLLYGQSSILLTALVIGSWVADRGERPRIAGFLLGVSVAVKLIPIVLVAFFVLKRRWRTAAWAIGTATALTVGAGFVIGMNGMYLYLTEALPATEHYRAAEGNYSLLAVIWRFFAGSRRILPAIDLPSAAVAVSVLTVMAILVIAARRIRAGADPDLGFSIAVSAMILVSPIVWQNYLALMLWPVAFLIRRLDSQGWPTEQTVALLGSLLLLTVPPGVVMVTVLESARVFTGGTIPSSLPAIGQAPLVLLSTGPALIFFLLLSVGSSVVQECTADGR